MRRNGRNCQMGSMSVSWSMTRSALHRTPDSSTRQSPNRRPQRVCRSWKASLFTLDSSIFMYINKDGVLGMEQSHPGLIDSDQTTQAMTANGEMKDMRKEFMPLEKVDEGKSTHTPEYDQVITNRSSRSTIAAYISTAVYMSLWINNFTRV